VYFSSRVIKSIPLTLAVLNNALRDVLLGMMIWALISFGSYLYSLVASVF
jgi:hypothetical protein